MAKNRPIVRVRTAVAKRPDGLYIEIRQLILDAREQTAQAVNAALTMTYWHIGNRVQLEILKSKRAGYGEEIVSALARQLQSEFGTSFGEKNLRRMIQFAETYPEQSIVVSLIRQLSWTHFIALIPLKDPLQRDFYAEMSRIERWSVRVLRDRIQSMLYERTAISKKPDKLIAQELQSLREEDKLTPDLVFRDPYVLDFLGLKDTYSEKDLDLLFYHRRLRRLIAVELKLGRFAPADAGQVELYLRWLDRHERQPGEDAPVALILCAGAKKETAEYLDLGGKGIHVAEYLTQLPPPHLLAKRLHTAVRRARERLAAGRLSELVHEPRRGK